MPSSKDWWRVPPGRSEERRVGRVENWGLNRVKGTSSAPLLDCAVFDQRRRIQIIAQSLGGAGEALEGAERGTRGEQGEADRRHQQQAQAPQQGLRPTEGIGRAIIHKEPVAVMQPHGEMQHTLDGRAPRLYRGGGAQEGGELHFHFIFFFSTH